MTTQTATDGLAVYLNDHLAGSSGGLELAQRLADRYPDGEEGAFLARLATEIEEDRDSLKQAMEALDIDENKIKQALGWAGEKLGRVKLSDGPATPEGLSKLMELEAMSLGVEGKLCLWRALTSAGVSAGLDLERMIERASGQREGLERLRLGTAAEALR